MTEVKQHDAANVKPFSPVPSDESLPEPPQQAGKLRSGGDVIANLHTEHGYMETLMSVLQHQVDKLEQGLPPDYSLMSSVVQYLDTVADTSHHPREDVMFEKLMSIDPDSRQSVEPLLTAHEAIERKTDNLLESLKTTMDRELPRNVDQVRRQANDYLKHLKKHLASEVRLYALIEKGFSEEDWQSILDRLQPPEDPLFGQRLDERYRLLVDHLREDLRQRTDDYTVAEFLSLGAFSEMLGSVARNSSRLASILRSGFKETSARDQFTLKCIFKSENRNVAKGIELGLDCMLDDYDTWVEKLSEVGHVLRDVRNEVAESYRSHKKVYHDMVRHD